MFHNLFLFVFKISKNLLKIKFKYTLFKLAANLKLKASTIKYIKKITLTTDIIDPKKNNNFNLQNYLDNQVFYEAFLLNLQNALGKMLNLHQ